MKIKENRAKRNAAWGGAIALAAIAVLLLRDRKRPEAPLPEIRLRDALITNEVYYASGESAPFSGFLTEYFEDGQIRTRIRVNGGVPDGISGAWHSNGLIRSRELFTNGVSHGARMRWHSNGVKKSEATIVAGALEGLFLEWHDNGALAKEIPLSNGVAHGTSRAWFPSGHLSARAVLESGEVVEQKFFEDGELKEASGFGAPAWTTNDWQAVAMARVAVALSENGAAQ